MVCRNILRFIHPSLLTAQICHKGLLSALSFLFRTALLRQTTERPERQCLPDQSLIFALLGSAADAGMFRQLCT